MVDCNGDSATHLSSRFDYPSMLQLLLDAGASMTACNWSDRTLLMEAAANGVNSCVTLLLARLGDKVSEQLIWMGDHWK